VTSARRGVATASRRARRERRRCARRRRARARRRRRDDARRRALRVAGLAVAAGELVRARDRPRARDARAEGRDEPAPVRTGARAARRRRRGWRRARTVRVRGDFNVPRRRVRRFGHAEDARRGGGVGVVGERVAGSRAVRRERARWRGGHQGARPE